MNNNTYRKVSGIVFAVMAVLHAVRIVYGWDVLVAGSWVAPMWVS